MNTKLSTILFSLSLLPSIGNAAQIAPVSISSTGTFSNSTSLIIDGSFPGESSGYNLSPNVFWNGLTPTFTIDYGSLHQIDDVVLSVDNNDSYLVEWSTDDVTWNSLFTIAVSDGEIGFGMDTMSSVSGDVEYVAGTDFASVTAQYLRIAAIGGDNKYSIGEFQAFGNVSAVPVPAAAWLFGSGLIGLVGVARRKK